jgi:hypothetical protein
MLPQARKTKVEEQYLVIGSFYTRKIRQNGQFLRSTETTVDGQWNAMQCNPNNKPLSLCGEISSRLFHHQNEHDAPESCLESDVAYST